jgi:hypothetical protein
VKDSEETTIAYQLNFSAALLLGACKRRNQW